MFNIAEINYMMYGQNMALIFIGVFILVVYKNLYKLNQTINVMETKVSNSEQGHEFDSLYQISDLKTIYGICVNEITEFLENFYNLNIETELSIPSNELLESDYINYKKDFIKEFYIIYGKSLLFRKFIEIQYASNKAFIKMLEYRFDLRLKSMYIELENKKYSQQYSKQAEN
jgi:hypothetical protein